MYVNLTGQGKCKIKSQQLKPAWQYTPIIAEHGRRRQEDQESAIQRFQGQSALQKALSEGEGGQVE